MPEYRPTFKIKTLEDSSLVTIKMPNGAFYEVASLSEEERGPRVLKAIEKAFRLGSRALYIQEEMKTFDMRVNGATDIIWIDEKEEKEDD